MESNIIVSMLVLTIGLLITVGLQADVEIALEAELANTIQAPMVIADDENLASDGKYIWAPGEPATGGGGTGWAEFIINIPEAGKYALWGHVIAWDGNSDSFWVTWQPADPNENPQATNNNQFRWSVAGGNAWHWDRINHWLDNNDRLDREWDFDKPGETVLRIGVREDATKLDAIFVTSNTKAANAAQANARLPTDADRKLQDEGLVVDAKGKVTTTWGSLKQAYK
ncbi:hypothetical protein C6501_07475 [Candidatus Poribacteria bacterium]|nr:MAG: hypothetical protein C6501_07475 [Candidatus Poribacteria bacterium]